MNFSIESWCGRLSEALRLLDKVQRPILDAYWQANGYPEIITFNGRDETPYPSDDLLDLYDAALQSTRSRGATNFSELRAALDPVRGILRSHPALGNALGHIASNDRFMVEVANGASLSWLSVLIVGLMERASEISSRGFERAAAELGSLLDLSASRSMADIPNCLDVGYDVLEFVGPAFDQRIDIKPNLTVAPLSKLQDWIDPSWLSDCLPEHVTRRDWSQIGAVLRPFRWRQRFQRADQPSNQEAKSRPNFAEEALSFLELLSVSNQTPVYPCVFLSDCINRVAFLLLGKARTYGIRQHTVSFGPRHDPFRKPPKLHENAIEQALRAFEFQDSETFGRLALVRRRLAEALARSGRFALDDRILDVSQSIELMFEIRGSNIGKKFQTSLADLLASYDDHHEAIRRAAKHFYDVRSAIVHGPSDDHRRRLMQDRELAFRRGFNLAQEAYFKLILEDGPPA